MKITGRSPDGVVEIAAVAAIFFFFSFSLLSTLTTRVHEDDEAAAQRLDVHVVRLLIARLVTENQ